MDDGSQPLHDYCPESIHEALVIDMAELWARYSTHGQFRAYAEKIFEKIKEFEEE